jgi:hypothetical protein
MEQLFSPRFLDFILLISIPPLLRAHLSLLTEVLSRPHKAARYNVTCLLCCWLHL